MHKETLRSHQEDEEFNNICKYDDFFSENIFRISENKCNFGREEEKIV